MAHGESGPAHGVSAREYHERTKHTPASVRADDYRLDYSNQPTPSKAYVDLPRVALARQVRPPQVPTLAALAPGAPDLDDRALRPAVDRDVLTQLCYYAVGVTKRIRRGGRDLLFRAAACTGALYHVDLYPVVGESGPVAPGVYHFDPTTLSLDVLRTGDYRGVLAHATGDEDRVREAPMTVVATSTWWRNAWKYRARTYRHAFWDGGTVLANLTAVAGALDRPTRVVTGFADVRLADLLGVDPDEEAPIALVPVGSDAPVPGPRTVEPIAPETAPLSRDPKSFPLIHDAYVGSSLADGDEASSWRERGTGGGVGTRPPGDGERVALERVGDDGASKTPLHVTIPRRGSCRAYEREDLNFRKVSTVLDRAVSGVPMDVRDPGGPALQLNDCYVLVNGVEGVDPGIYHYHPDADGVGDDSKGGGELELLRSGECRREAGHLALDQDLGADAAVCVYFMTDLDAVVERLGDRGYRAAQLEAGLTAGKLYLATYAHRGLGGTGLTFYDDEVTEFLSPRAAGQTPTFLYTFGRPA